ncbi:TIGR02117 family protein [Mangrovivirga cuniculi]|uniref:TIGR02117 family protein n=1 Tax=Mangrovivirga cuniculi TaxID=2715131 RepID=A0A4D7JLT1_9BACT|nr:TIGR02117 family protein [Mangrovivirga cuniculi]QCK14460.1 TIGR02117 family protein [Mangrovivirga cuniculi]
MKYLKLFFKVIFSLLLLPLIYFLIAIILTWIPVNNDFDSSAGENQIYLSTNGVHADIIIPIDYFDSAFINQLDTNPTVEYLSFGWGDENFYLNTTTWADLTVKNAITALFVDSPTLIHLTKYSNVSDHWVKTNINHQQLGKLKSQIVSSFEYDNGKVQLLEGAGYHSNDNFYKATGSYNLFNTCNSWTNKVLKNSGLRACVWTPFDFGIINKYE